MYARSLLGNREISSLACRRMDRSASGRRGAIADDERTGEVRLRRSSYEDCEQGWGTSCGVGGAKGGDQGEHGSVTHAPGADPGKRATGAGACTASCKTAEEGAVHRASTPRPSRPTSDGI